MSTQNLIKGLHHVTATVSDAKEDYQFYTQLLGQRLVKKTVNFDNNQVYHFYYGNETGDPGTIMTTFPYKGHGVRIGVKGTGQVAVTAFSAPVAAIDFWKSRLSSHDVDYTETVRFGDSILHFDDPSGLELEIIFTDNDGRTPWTTDEISIDFAIRGIHSVTLSIKEVGSTFEFLTQEFGLTKVGEEDKYTRFVSVEGAVAGNYVDVRSDEDLDRGKNGIGTVHHVAWRVENDEALLAMRKRLSEELGFKVTDVKDRNYFHSIYFRMPGGVLFEIATLPPGFLIDEAKEALGEDLKLPEWEEVNRAQIESILPEYRKVVKK